MQIRRFDLDGPAEIVPQKFSDDRGYFAETFNEARLAKEGIREPSWVQDNQSFSAHAFTLRGLHFQLAPFAQAKLVRVLKGSVLDVAVDIRPASATFRKWIAVKLSDASFNQLYVPAGFAHGFLTLEENVEVVYKVSTTYSKDHDRSVRWDDPALGIRWPLPTGTTPVLSAKDAAAPLLAEVTNQLIW
jgi:dTDP-4-dehydrorhamnose 3,5-epimerase